MVFLETMDEKTFRKRPGTTDRGRDYEDLVVSRIILELLMDERTINFQISANDENFGDFDDVVISTLSEDGTVKQLAIQLKHAVSKDKLLSKSSLSAPKGDFSLKKYYESYRKINKHNYNLILFTNLKSGFSNGERIAVGENINVKVTPCERNPLVNTSEDGHCYTFEVEESDFQDIADYKYFFARFFLYTNQRNVEQLHQHTTIHFRRLFHGDVDTFSKYVNFVSDWSKRDGWKDKLDKTFMRKLVAIHLVTPFVKPFGWGVASANARILRKAMSNFDVVMLEKELEDSAKQLLRDNLDDIDLKTLNRTRIQYQFWPHHVTRTDELSGDLRAVFCWLLHEVPLIVEANETVYEAVQLCQHGHFIILCKETPERPFRNVFRNLFDLEKHPDIQSAILENFKCTFQGKEASLKELVQNSIELKTCVSVKDLLLIATGPYEIGGAKETCPEPYISRFISRSVVDIKYLNEASDRTLIVVSCKGKFQVVRSCFYNINLVDIRQYVENRNCGSRFNKTSKREVYVSQDWCCPSDFNFICACNPGFARYHHLAIGSDNMLEWIQTKGDVSDLVQHHITEPSVSEGTLYPMNSPNNISIVVADPGMGKTVFMKNLKNNTPLLLWTVLLNSKDISMLCKIRTDEVLDFIVNEKFDLDKTFEINLSRRLIETGQLVLFWDALDEIFPDQLEQAVNIISHLRKDVRKQWISARTSLKKTLEAKFSVLSNTLCLFRQEDQVHYVHERLHSPRDAQDMGQVLKNVLTNVLYTAQINLLGVPLQIFLLTELFRQDRAKYTVLFGRVRSLADLYGYFVEEQFSVFFKEKALLDLQNPCTRRAALVLKEDYLKKYQQAALTAVLKQKLQYDILTCIKEERECFGLITSITEPGVPIFLHYSYAEYFVANYFVENYQTLPDLKDILVQDRNTTIRLFFDMLLAKESIVHNAVLYKNVDLLRQHGDDLCSKDLGGRNSLQVACTWGQRYPDLSVSWCDGRYVIDNEDESAVSAESSCYKKMLEFLLDHCDPLETDRMFGLDSLSYAIAFGCIFPAAMIIQCPKFDTLELRTNCKFVCNLMYYSAKFGYECLIDAFKDSYFVVSKRERNSLLHICVGHQQTSCLQELLSAVRYKQAIDDRNILDMTPLHIACFCGYVEIARLLIEHGANVDVTLQDGYTSLHLACHSGHAEVVELLVPHTFNLEVHDKTPTCGRVVD